MGVLYNLLITRPYSWITIVSIALLGGILARGTLIPDIYSAIDVLFAMSVWVTFASFTEYWHAKTDSRVRITKQMLLGLIALVFIICLLRNPVTIVLVLLLVLFNVLYSFKIKPWKLSHFSFVFRGFLETLILIGIIFFYGRYDVIPYSIPVVVAIFLFTDARNLIGDVRDIDIDKFTFPKKYGAKSTCALSAILILAGIFVTGNIMISLPMLVPFFALILKSDKKHSYKTHKISVLATTFFILNYAAYLLDYSLIITNLFFLASILNFTYDLVPRKSNHYYIQ